MFWWVIWWHDGQSKRPLRQDKHGHYFLISHLLFVLQYFYHNFESCCWTIYTNRKIILHDVFVQLQSIFNSTNINHGQSYPIFGFWLKYFIKIKINYIRLNAIGWLIEDSDGAGWLKGQFYHLREENTILRYELAMMATRTNNLRVVLSP